MIQLDRLFQNLFSEKDIRPSRLIVFAKTHLAALEKNNPAGIFDLIISQTEALIQNLHAADNQKYSYRGDRKGQAVEKVLLRQTIINYLRLKEGLVKSVFGKESAPYVEFFPDGLTLLYTSTDTGFTSALDILLKRTIQYEAELGTGFRTELTNLLNEWKQSNAVLRQAKAHLSSSQIDVRQGFEALGVQLSKNAYTIALAYMNQPEKAGVYFEQHLLLPAKRHRIFKGTITGGEIKTVCAIVYSPGKRIRLVNKGASLLRIQMLLGEQPVGEIVEVASGETIRIRFDRFFNNGTALQLTNPRETEGMYQVSILS